MLWRYVRPPCLRQGQQAAIRCLEPSTTNHVTSHQSRLRIALRYSSNNSASVLLPETHTAVASDLPSPPQHPHEASTFSKNASLIEQPPGPGTKVTVAGLIRSIRKQKRAAFAHVSDGSSFQPIQAVLRPEDARNLHNGAYVELDGMWKESPGAGQTHEIHVDKVLRVGQSDVEASPIQKKSMTVDHLRNYPHLRLRLPLYSLLSRVRSQVISSIHDYYSGTNSPADEATFVQPPIITSSDCEGAGEVFTVSPKLRLSPQADKEKQEEVHYFRSPKYLTVSSQLHLEAYAAEIGDVWTLSPAFRAEESDTGRHLSEVWMQEAEHRGITDLSELTMKVEGLIRHVVDDLTKHRTGNELLEYYSDKRHRPDESTEVNIVERWSALTGPKWHSVTYTDAMKVLEAAASTNKSLFKYEPTWESGLQLEHERWIVENLGKNKPVFVTHYPKKQKPFYMLPSPTDSNEGATVECFDLLMPGIGELVGGSLREHGLPQLIENMREKGLLASSSEAADSDVDYPHLRRGESLGGLQWYCDLRRYGSSPHGGFGLGFDRLLMYLTGVTNVRDMVPFPRTYKSCLA